MINVRLLNNKKYTEHGAIALIVVIFSLLLLLTISAGFVSLVVKDQSRTGDNELSNGAYDSALAGVEDGKRVLQQCIASEDTDACSAISANECNTIHRSKILDASDGASNTSEIVIERKGSGSVADTGEELSGGYDQAYTCVKILRNTNDYEGSLQNDVSQVIPLRTAGAFNELKLFWFKDPGSSVTVNLPSESLDPKNPTYGSWSSVSSDPRPPLLRVQLIQFDDRSFNMSDFDLGSNSSTLYLYPSSNGTTGPISFNLDNRRTNNNTNKVRVTCQSGVGLYVCGGSDGITLELPNPAGINNDADRIHRQAYLRITSLYGGTDFKLMPVGTQFQDVEPAIDSTGRAADVFRRVEARVQLIDPMVDQLYPRATVDITHNFCKDFGITTTVVTPVPCDFSQP